MAPTRAPVHRPYRIKAKNSLRYQGAVYQAMYQGRWRRYSKARLLEHPLCVECVRERRPRIGTITDHVIPHRGDERLFWDPRNHQTLCKTHHDRKTATEDGGFGNPRRVRALERLGDKTPVAQAGRALFVRRRT